jgi:hypothetical protein
MEQGEAFKVILWTTVGCSVLFGFAIGAVICWFLSKWLGRIPAAHRRIEPSKVWLMLIPLFGFVWMFFVYLRMSDSFAAYFRSKGEEAPSARGLALAYCIAVAATIPFSAAQVAVNPVYRGEALGPPTPLLLGLQLGGGCISLAALVLWILVMVRFYGLKERIPAPPP